MPQFGLHSATRVHEAGITSNRGSACHGECVPGSCTHRPSHHGSWFYLKARFQTLDHGGVESSSLSRPTNKIKGGLAQLGERLICIQEVSGSIPLSSTKNT